MKIIPRNSPSLPKNVTKLFFKYFLKRKLGKGNHINNLEKEFAKYVGTRHAVSVVSARTGLYLLLKALNLKKDDEIVLASYGSMIVPNVLSVLNLKPVFVDVNEKTFNVDISKIKQKITEKTKAIIITHVEGFPCSIGGIMNMSKKYNLIVIEDCAHALSAEYKGKKVGSFGNAGIFSFGMGKHLNTLGGGMIVTNDEKIYKKINSLVKRLKYPSGMEIFEKFLKGIIVSILTKPLIFALTIYPLLIFTTPLKLDIVYEMFEEKPTFSINKYLKRLSNFQAIIGLEQLKDLNRKIERKSENARTYDENLRKSIKRQKALIFTRPSYLNYSVILRKRDYIKRRLLFKGIDTQSTWMEDCSQHTQFKSFSNCNVSNFLEKNTIYLPIHENLKHDDIVFISKELNKLCDEIERCSINQP